MKDHSQIELEASRPPQDALHTINYCLEQLFVDKDKMLGDACAGSMDYDELIGSLLQARDAVERLNSLDEWSSMSCLVTEDESNQLEQFLSSIHHSEKGGNLKLEVNWKTRECSIT